MNKKHIKALVKKEHHAIAGPSAVAEALGWPWKIGSYLALINDGAGTWPDREKCLIDLWRRVRLNPPPPGFTINQTVLHSFDALYGTTWGEKFTKWCERNRLQSVTVNGHLL